jgi:hypothetical protein
MRYRLQMRRFPCRGEAVTTLLARQREASVHPGRIADAVGWPFRAIRPLWWPQYAACDVLGL